jgi:4-amino-4-deoxy-L-arabinose transferase-like glycosyltransferase
MSDTIRKLGFWSAILSALSAILWFITFNLKDALGPVPDWQNIEAYAQAFSVLRILYVYPSLVLAVTFIVLMACIHRWAPDDRKVWSLIGLALAVVYSTMASINYNIQAVAVSKSLESGQTVGITMLLPDHPNGVFSALANSYVYMSLAMVFTGFVFAGTRLEAWIRGLFLVQILSAAGQVGTSMFGLSPVVLYGTGLIWALGAPTAFVLLAIWFRRAEQTSTFVKESPC